MKSLQYEGKVVGEHTPKIEVIRVLGVEIPSVYLLPRRDEYTRVYTSVYPRVHNCIHACTQVRSKYLLCRARLYVYSLGIMPRIFSDGLRLPGI